MPANLKLFERLAYLSVFASIATFALENAGPKGAHFGIWTMTAIVAATLATAMVFISGTVRYRINWLRWLYASLMLIGVAAEVWLIPATFGKGCSAWIQALAVISKGLDLVCVYLLFSASARDWFRSGGVSEKRAVT